MEYSFDFDLFIVEKFEFLVFFVRDYFRFGNV